MHVAEQLTIPTFEDLPKREKSRLQKVWEHFAEVRAIAKEHGLLVPIALAADLAGVSRQRIDELCERGLVIRIELNGRPFVTENSFVAWAKSERQVGRPLQEVSFRRARQIARDFQPKSRR